MQIASFDVDDDKRAEIVRISEHRDRSASHPSRDNGHGPSRQVGLTLKQALVSFILQHTSELRAAVPMLYKTFSTAAYGIDANIIEVAVDLSGVKLNEVHFHTVGLPNAAVRESQDRVRSAPRNCGYDVPPTYITVNLAPADIRKEGSGFDLSMALGILGAYGGLNKKELLDFVFVGDGRSMA